MTHCTTTLPGEPTEWDIVRVFGGGVYSLKGEIKTMFHYVMVYSKDLEPDYMHLRVWQSY